MVIDDSKPNPSAVRSQLREWEDYNLALRLQDQEFGTHYDHNRSERRTVGNDTKHSKIVQQSEDAQARALRRQAFRQIEETDEQLAQRLAAEWNAEESRKSEEKLRQELIDEEIARRLAESGEFAAEIPSSSTPADSSYPASNLPVQPPSYDFAVRQSVPPREDILIDFASQEAQHQAPSSSIYSTQPANPPATTPTRRGVPLPGLATISATAAISPTSVISPTSSVVSPTSPVISPPSIAFPSRQPPPISTSQLTSQPSLDSPIAWPPPPPSVLNSNVPLAPNNPFLADLMGSNNISVAQPSVVPPSIGFTQPISAQPPSIGFQSEFGLPPPSSLALGLSGVGSHHNK